jgi:signal recognition particle subunit SRP72
LQVNEAVYDLQVGKFGAVRHKAASHPGDAQWEALKVIAGGENHTGKDLLRKLEPTLEKDKSNTGLALTVAQLRASAGNFTGAIQVLEALLEERKVIEPGVVGLLVHLYQTQGRKKGVADLLAKASEFPSGSTGPVSLFPSHR